MGIDCPSFTKINIGLKILGQRNDGFHRITTIFQELQFGDNISIVQSGQGCNIISDVDWIPSDKKNICYKAYEELIKKFPDLDGIKIIINKNVPVGSGLGGGSANAAAVLKGVCKLYDLEISNNELKKIALKIGADVPFFI
jgi:4-diphosphocytidyl-2-C-methyl-D-erythritol kinase